MMDKQRIIETSKDLFMEFGIRSVSMDDVSRTLGISKKTLYSHIETKRELIECAVAAHQAEECADMQNILDETADALAALVNMGRYIIELVKKIKPGVIYDLRKYYRQIYENWNAEHSRHIIDTLTRNLNKGIAQGYYRNELDVEVIARLYVGKVQTIMNDDVFPSNRFKQEHVVRQHLFYHLHGILTQKGREKLYRSDLLNKKLES